MKKITIRKKRAWLSSLLGLAIVIAEIYLRVGFPCIAGSIIFMGSLITNASIVGAMPRKPRTHRSQMVCSILGWPMFVILLGLIALSVYEMVNLDAPQYMLIIGFLGVLAQLTWKTFIHPTLQRRPKV